MKNWKASNSNNNKYLSRLPLEAGSAIYVFHSQQRWAQKMFSLMANNFHTHFYLLLLVRRTGVLRPLIYDNLANLRTNLLMHDQEHISTAMIPYFLKHDQK